MYVIKHEVICLIIQLLHIMKLILDHLNFVLSKKDLIIAHSVSLSSVLFVFAGDMNPMLMEENSQEYLEPLTPDPGAMFMSENSDGELQVCFSFIMSPK